MDSEEMSVETVPNPWAMAAWHTKETEHTTANTAEPKKAVCMTCLIEWRKEE